MQFENSCLPVCVCLSIYLSLATRNNSLNFMVNHLLKRKHINSNYLCSFRTLRTTIFSENDRSNDLLFRQRVRNKEAKYVQYCLYVHLRVCTRQQGDKSIHVYVCMCSKKCVFLMLQGLAQSYDDALMKKILGGLKIIKILLLIKVYVESNSFIDATLVEFG